MDEKLITLTDGTKLEVKVNFLTLYMIQKRILRKFDRIKRKMNYLKMKTWKQRQVDPCNFKIED